MRAGAADKRIVFRDRPVGVDPQDLAHVAVELLRLRPVHRVDAEPGRDGGRHEERAVRRLNRAPAGALGVQQHLQAFEPPVVGRELRARDRQDAGRTRQRGLIRAFGQHRISKVERPVGGERLVGQHFEQALSARPQVGRQPFDGLRDLAVLSDDPDPSRPLADDDAAVGKEVEAEARRSALRRRSRRRTRTSSPAADARVCPSHCGIGWYPSGAALSPGGTPGAAAGGRGITRGACAEIAAEPSTPHTTPASHTLRVITPPRTSNATTLNSFSCFRVFVANLVRTQRSRAL